MSIIKFNENNPNMNIIKDLANSSEADEEVEAVLKKYSIMSTKEKEELGEEAVASLVRVKHSAVELVEALGYTQQQNIVKDEKISLLDNELNHTKNLLKVIEKSNTYDKKKIDNLKKDYINNQLTQGKHIPGNLILACDALKNFRTAKGNKINPNNNYVRF